jgi:hypothetical protein
VKPSDALRQGLCPYCIGRGEIENIIEGMVVCRLCAGTRKWPPPVGLRDNHDFTLHLPSRVHLVTLCGLVLEECTATVVDAMSWRRVCPECLRTDRRLSADQTDQ